MDKIKILGLGLGIAGAVVSLAQSAISDKQTDAKIAEKVAEALANSKQEG